MSSLVLAHDTPELKLVHFATEANNLKLRFRQAANQALYALQELEVQAELSIEEIADHFGIHHFGIHITTKSLKDCKIVLTSDSHLEIHHASQQHPTRFQVARKQLLVV